jgi:invasion protein IalB
MRSPRPLLVLGLLVVVTAGFYFLVTSRADSAPPAKPAVATAEPSAPKPSGERSSAAKPAEERFGDWTLACQTDKDGKKECIVALEMQGSGDDGNKGRLVRLTMIHKPDKKGFFLVSLLPLGISVQAGAAVSIDDAPQVPMALQRCTNAGCESLLAVDDALLQKMKQGKILKVGFNAGTKTLVVPVPLKGFDQAMAKLP